MENVTLKKKTSRSLVEFARFSNDFYKDKTVEYCIEHKPMHLVWIYYNVQWITFTDDVLDRLHIFPDKRIEKPGIYPEGYEKRVHAAIRYRHGDKANFVIKARKHKKDVQELRFQEKSEVLTKAQLQALNHGHGVNFNR